MRLYVGELIVFKMILKKNKISKVYLINLLFILFGFKIVEKIRIVKLNFWLIKYQIFLLQNIDYIKRKIINFQ